MCLYGMVAGKLPFEQENLPTLFRKIERADYVCPAWFSPGLVDVLGKILEPKPDKRCTQTPPPPPPPPTTTLC